MEARNLAPLPGDVNFAVGASLPISGLIAWQGLFQHGRLQGGPERLESRLRIGSSVQVVSSVMPRLIFPCNGDFDRLRRVSSWILSMRLADLVAAKLVFCSL